MTEAAVRAFQKRHRLLVDGIVGAQTAAALAGDAKARNVKPGALRKGDLRRVRRAARSPRSKSRNRKRPARRAGGGLLVASELSEFAPERWLERLHPRGFRGRFRDKPGSRVEKGALPNLGIGGSAPRSSRYGTEGERLVRRSRGVKRGSPEGITRRQTGGDAARRQIMREAPSPLERKPAWAKRPLDQRRPPGRGPVEERVLGPWWDTQEKYSFEDPRTGARIYHDPERKRLHDRIVSGFRRGADGKEKPGPAGRRPRSVYTSGGPASGKGRFERPKPGEMPAISDERARGVLTETGERVSPETENAVRANPDDARVFLPEYEEMQRAGEPRAAPASHEESSDVKKRIIREARDGGQDLFIDGVGGGRLRRDTKDGGPGKFEARLDEDLKAGREVEVYHVFTPLERAVQNEEKRYRRAKATYDAAKTDEERTAARRSLRRVDLEYLRTSHRESSAVILELAGLLDGDPRPGERPAKKGITTRIYYGPDTTLIAYSKPDGSVVVVSPERVAELRRKANA